MAVREGSFFASGNAVRLGTLLLLGVALSAVSFFRVGSLLGPVEHLPPGTEWIAEVDRGHLYPYEGNYSTYLETKAARLAAEARAGAGRRRVL